MAPDWWRALTLVERLAAVPASGRTLRADDWELRRRLDRWRGLPPFDDAAAIAGQLASLGASEEQFVAAVGAQADSLAGAVEWPDAQWRDETDDVEPAAPPGPEGFSLRTIAEPIVRVARRRLRARVADIAARCPSLPFDPDTVDSLFDDHLRRRLTGMLTRTLVLELHAARLDGGLDGATPEERFRSFAGALHERGALLRLLGDYPVLARRIVGVAQQWVEASAELLDRLATDVDVLRAKLFPEREPGPLQAVSADLGDHHGNGRSVRVLLFASGARVVYKPRSLAVGRHWNALLEWAGAHEFAPGFRTVRLVDRGEYGWMEFVAARPCRSLEEVRRFYERQGGYLALLYLLGATDFHHENVIADGDNPVLVDLEGLPGAAIPPPESARTYGLVDAALADSVLHTGLLPIPWGGANEDAGDSQRPRRHGGTAFALRRRPLGRRRHGRDAVRPPASDDAWRPQSPDVERRSRRRAVAGRCRRRRLPRGLPDATAASGRAAGTRRTAGRVRRRRGSRDPARHADLRGSSRGGAAPRRPAGRPGQ